MSDRMIELEEQLVKLNDELATEKLRQKSDLTIDAIIRHFRAFIGDLSSPEVRERILDLFVDKIYIAEDEMTITFNYSEDKRSLGFEDMKVILKRRRTIMEMMEGYQGGNASAQMLSSLICTDNNKESFF